MIRLFHVRKDPSLTFHWSTVMNGYSTRLELDGRKSCAPTDCADLTIGDVCSPWEMIARAFNDYEGHAYQNVTLAYEDVDGAPTPTSPPQAAKPEYEEVVKKTMQLDPTDLSRKDIRRTGVARLFVYIYIYMYIYICLFIYSFIYLFIYLFIYTFIYASR